MTTYLVPKIPGVPIIKMDKKRIRELRKILRSGQEVHCLDMPSYLATLQQAIEIGATSKIVKDFA
ncbi:MAG: hypothetical protein WC346_03600 [Methanogenium sp.]|jgi:hypothetical protein